MAKLKYGAQGDAADACWADLINKLKPSTTGGEESRPVSERANGRHGGNEPPGTDRPAIQKVPTKAGVRSGRPMSGPTPTHPTGVEAPSSAPPPPVPSRPNREPGMANRTKPSGPWPHPKERRTPPQTAPPVANPPKAGAPPSPGPIAEPRAANGAMGPSTDREAAMQLADLIDATRRLEWMGMERIQDAVRLQEEARRLVSEAQAMRKTIRQAILMLSKQMRMEKP